MIQDADWDGNVPFAEREGNDNLVPRNSGSGEIKSVCGVLEAQESMCLRYKLLENKLYLKFHQTDRKFE